MNRPSLDLLQLTQMIELLDPKLDIQNAVYR
jgi:hypothetical protein